MKIVLKSETHTRSSPHNSGAGSVAAAAASAASSHDSGLKKEPPRHTTLMFFADDFRLKTCGRLNAASQYELRRPRFGAAPPTIARASAVTDPRRPPAPAATAAAMAGSWTVLDARGVWIGEGSIPDEWRTIGW